LNLIAGKTSELELSANADLSMLAGLSVSSTMPQFPETDRPTHQQDGSWEALLGGVIGRPNARQA
jgi:hypothetical protein